MWLQPRQRWKEKVTALQFFINVRLFVLWRPLELIYDHLSFNLNLSSCSGCPHAQKHGWFIVVNLKCNVWPFAQKSFCESSVIAWRTFIVIHIVWVLSQYRVTLVIMWCSTQNSEIKWTLDCQHCNRQIENQRKAVCYRWLLWFCQERRYTKQIVHCHLGKYKNIPRPINR